MDDISVETFSKCENNRIRKSKCSFAEDRLKWLGFQEEKQYFYDSRGLPSFLTDGLSLTYEWFIHHSGSPSDDSRDSRSVSKIVKLLKT